METKTLKSNTFYNESSNSTEETTFSKTNISPIETTIYCFLQSKSIALSPIEIDHDEVPSELSSVNSPNAYAPLLMFNQTSISKISKLSI